LLDSLLQEIEECCRDAKYSEVDCLKNPGNGYPVV